MNKKNHNESTYRSLKEFKARFFPESKVESIIENIDEAREYGAAMARDSIGKVRISLSIRNIRK